MFCKLWKGQMMSGQTTIIETDNDTGENEVTIIDNDTGEIIEVETETELEAVEAVTDSAVLIAEIEAEKEVEIVGIQAAVDIARIEAQTNNESEFETWLKNQMENQALAIAELQSQVSLFLGSQLTLQPLAEPAPEPEPAPMETPAMEPESVNADALPEPEPVAPKRRIRAI